MRNNDRNDNDGNSFIRFRDAALVYTFADYCTTYQILWWSQSSQVEFRLVLNSATPFPERCYQAEKKMGGVWNQLWMFGFSNKRRLIKKRHEIRLSIQFAGLMIAFLFFFVYSVGQYVFNHTRQIALLYEWRQLNPLMNCFLSCIQPWMCLFFNNDIRGKLLRILGYRRSEVKQTSFVMPVTSHTSRK
ncbi:hypothetical protein RB195_003299 [Necator americanus]|uniref:7TM GPCR serpentine receptor class x (Srx) domain-containing protein n=1 Tax=Necator americanus TaxID=51031 RepID=A0ABR1DMW6_NECAM